MVPLSEAQALNAVQRYVAEMEEERGFSHRTVLQQCLLLGEEVGELFKAIRKQQNLTVDPNSTIGNVEDELADVLIYLCAIANRLDIDLEDAFRKKEARNEERVWAAPQP
ncbi:MAG TPA: MazG nucleotide pyrophosphohydrolase domain-containing protein [Mycobacteriales bacterium]|nr:MazG nucleotide pyrophosphohydrolase domain-containing protein [Mycobacteriales bacterium]